MNVVSVTLDINSIKTKEERSGAVTRRQSLLRILCFANDLFSFHRHEEVNFPSLQNEKDRFLSYWLS